LFCCVVNFFQRQFAGWANNFAGMAFVQGEACWQAPPRSSKIEFQCAGTEALKSVEETSRCVYYFVFETPAACTVEHEKELEQRIQRAKAIFDRKE